jgi:hypothetical protein
VASRAKEFSCIFAELAGLAVLDQPCGLQPIGPDFLPFALVSARKIGYNSGSGTIQGVARARGPHCRRSLFASA